MEVKRSNSSPAKLGSPVMVVTPSSSPQKLLKTQAIDSLITSPEDNIEFQEDSDKVRTLASHQLAGGGGSSFGVGDINLPEKEELNSERKNMQKIQTQKQKLLQKSTNPQTFTHEQLGEMFSQTRSTNLQIVELLGELGQKLNQQQEHLEPVPEQQVDTISMIRDLDKKLNAFKNGLDNLARQQHLLEIRNATNTQRLLQGQEQIQTGVQQTNEGIGRVEAGVGRVEAGVGRVEAGVGRVELNVEAGIQEGRVAAAAAAAQLAEARQFMEKRFNDVIKNINTGLRSDAGCLIVYNEGYGMWLNSLLWCIWVFLRNCYALIQYVRGVYLGVKQYFLDHLPDAPIPVKTFFVWFFSITEWLIIWLIVNKIGTFFGYANIGIDILAGLVNFILDAIWNVFSSMGYIFKQLFGEENANALWAELKKNKVIDFLLNFKQIFTRWIYELIRDAIYGAPAKKGGQPEDENIQNALVINSNFDSNMTSQEINAFLMEISSEKSKKLINEMQASIDENYKFLNNFTDYIYNMLLGQEDKTFCQFASSNSDSIIEFKRSITSFDNLMYQTFIGSERLTNSPNITELSAGAKRTKRNKNRKYKKVTSKLKRKKTQKKLKKRKNKNISKK